MEFKPWSVMGTCIVGFTAIACGTSDGSSMKEDNALGAPNPDGQPGDAQTPPTTNGDDVEAWLKKGKYESWTCETVEHPQMGVSPHGKNRVCINDIAAAFSVTDAHERPVGSAAVKELYDDRSKLVGYAVSVKIKPKSGGGDNWYWYERVPLDSAAPHDSNGVVADGLGSTGAAQSVCVSCHAAAGSDKAHEVMSSSDFIYLQPRASALNPDGDSQTPPTSDADKLEAWLTNGDYTKWACETVEHPQMGVSPHGKNRVCSNDLAAGFSGKAGDERPLGTASVKELYDDDSQLAGYSVAVKVGAQSSGGAAWYWYERVPTSGVVANGLGDSGTPKSVCVGCHGGAGSDSKHSVTGSSDFVYLQVTR
jgi:hypothetical protein